MEPWQPPEVLEKDGPDDRKIVEITVEAGTPLDFLEDILGEFLEMERHEEPEP